MKLIYLFLIALFLFFPSNTFAQSKSNDFSLSINPSTIEIEAHAPAIPETDITINNKSDKDVTLDILLAPFTMDLQGNGQAVYYGEREAREKLSKIGNKVVLFEGENPVSKVKLAPFESKTLKLKIDVNGDFPEGDHYFTVLFSSEGSNTTSKSTVAASGGIGAHVIASIGNKLSIGGRISEFKAPFLLSHGPVPFKLLLNNSGDRYVIPRGYIEISDMFGNNKGRVDILPQYILSKSNRYLLDSRRIGLKDGQAVWPEKFLLGLYKAKAVIKLSEKSQPLTSTTYFIGIPFIVLIGSSIAAFVACGIYLRVKRKVKKSENK